MEATTAPTPVSMETEIEADFIPGIRLLARLARVAERACQESGISLPQYRLLVSIASRPQRASDLALQVGVSRPTLTSLVDGLAHSNLLRRVPVPSDRRGIQLAPTEEGRIAMRRAESVLSRRLLELVPADVASTVAPVVMAVEAALNQVAEPH
jgi:DNA-binding MarR family transcriptional regulator